MGLTVHFDLIAPPDTDAAQARELVAHLRRKAQRFCSEGRVDAVHPLDSGPQTLRWAAQYKSVPHPWKQGCGSGIEIPAEEGFMFVVKVGKDCEPLWLGLCRYPKTVVLGGRRYRTALNGWRFHGFSKTQYASLHGWEHFRRCHVAVVHLVASARRLGLEVRINDEGEYWPGRSTASLRRNLEEMNGIVAAAAGALKDATSDEGGQPPVESPIFAHPQFEHLEARGQRRQASKLLETLTAIRRT